ncbi:MFS transporter [Mycolicibacterium gadium]|jgi:MFS family permease|uniref:MDR family MFS transporter n=1 Tax=Mycolicibacterium gadium TaxID=1794 RepID=UPI002FDDE8AE
MGFIGQFRSFDPPTRMLMINQFGINLGFYMLMPYLAGYLAGPLGLAAWAIGLVLGVRNFSQQGMFIVGGTLADRLGYKPLIVAGCLLRTGGFALLAFAQSLPTVLIASAATGFAGALFNPAVRAYLAADAGERRLEAFAVFNIFYQAGILLGPLVGVALMVFDFRITALAAAIVFAALTVAQLMALPQHSADEVLEKTSIIDDWRTVVRNRSFLLFAVAMIGSYVLSFQVYLTLPLQAKYLAPHRETVLVAAIFAVSGVVAVAGQLRITRWFAARWGSGHSLVIGMMVLAISFVPLAVLPDADRFGTAAAVGALIVSAGLLAVGSAAVFPFEMDTVVSLSNGRLVATHYGFYNTIIGVGILFGNLAAGSILGAARDIGWSELVWAGLIVIGVLSAAALYHLDRKNHLRPSVD